jgi:hypothetical protein
MNDTPDGLHAVQKNGSTSDGTGLDQKEGTGENDFQHAATEEKITGSERLSEYLTTGGIHYSESGVSSSERSVYCD